jgi:hypothetical protein
MMMAKSRAIPHSQTFQASKKCAKQPMVVKHLGKNGMHGKPSSLQVFPAQKMVFLPKGATNDAIVTYTAAFEAVKARADFAEISSKRLGKYPQMTGAAAEAAKVSGTNVSADAKAFIVNWLQEKYGVSLN